MTIASLANVKAHFSSFIDSVQGTHERVTITRNGEPAAVLMSPDDLESLLETLAILSEPGAVEEIRRAQAELDAGGGISSDELLEELAARRSGASA